MVHELIVNMDSYTHLTVCFLRGGGEGGGGGGRGPLFSGLMIADN